MFQGFGAYTVLGFGVQGSRSVVYRVKGSEDLGSKVQWF